MGNIDNKEKEFAEILKQVTRFARENKNVITSEQVKEAFSELDFDDKQFEMVFEYLKNHKISVDGEAVDTDEGLSTEEKNYLQDYIESLEALPAYSDGEKKAISMSAIAGDKDAQSKLIEMYLPLVVDVARMYSEQGVFLEDLIGEGNVALTKGVTMLDAVGEPDVVDAEVPRKRAVLRAEECADGKPLGDAFGEGGVAAGVGVERGRADEETARIECVAKHHLAVAAELEIGDRELRAVVEGRAHADFAAQLLARGGADGGDGVPKP